jgi:hypothetical protein
MALSHYVCCKKYFIAKGTVLIHQIKLGSNIVKRHFDISV